MSRTARQRPISSGGDGTEDEYPATWNRDDPDRRKRFTIKVWKHTGSKWKCHYCRKTLDPIAGYGTDKQVTIDHIVPQKLGKYQGLWNLVLCCNRCGKLKGSMPYEMFTGETELPEQCRSHFRTTYEAVFAVRFKESWQTIEHNGQHPAMVRRYRNGSLP